jgi:hypothetical protein
MTEAVAVVWCLSLALVALVCWMHGYSFAVRETEQRWSEAVQRADARRMPTR